LRPIGLSLVFALALCSTLAAAQGARDPGAVRHEARARASLERGALRPAERALSRWIAVDPADPLLAEVVLSRIPPTAAEAAALPAPEAEARGVWVQEWLERLTPTDPLPLARGRAWALAVAGDLPAALAALARVVGVHDEAGALALRRLAALAIHRGALPLAEHALALAQRAWSDDPAVGRDRAALHLALGEPREAVRLLRAELVHRPDHRGLRDDLAGALLADGQPGAAYREWSRLATVGAGEDAGRLQRAAGRAALALGRPELARVASRRALAVDRGDGEARLLLGLALAAQGHLAAARNELSEARALLGGDLRVERALESLEERSEAGAR